MIDEYEANVLKTARAYKAAWARSWTTFGTSPIEELEALKSAARQPESEFCGLCGGRGHVSFTGSDGYLRTMACPGGHHT